MKIIKIGLFIALLISVIFTSCKGGGVTIGEDSRLVYPQKTAFSFVDSASLNAGSFDDHAGSRLFSEKALFKLGDSLKWSTETDTLKWRKPDTSLVALKRYVYKGNIWYMFPIKLSQSVLNQPISIGYKGDGAFQIFVNGKIMVEKGIVSATKEIERIKSAHGYFYIAFNTPHNYITIRASNHNSELIPASINIFIGSDKLQRRVIETESASDTICIALGIFYFTFFLIYLNLFYSDKRVKANLHFSLFCFCMFFLFFTTANVTDPENYELSYFLNILQFVGVAPLFYTFTCFLHHLVFGQLKKYLRWVIVLPIAAPSIYFLAEYTESEVYWTASAFVFIALALFAFIDGIRVVFLGLKKKVSGIKPIIYGVFATGFLLTGLFVVRFILPIFEGNSYFLICSISLTIIPISVSVALIRNYTQTSKQLALELINVSTLSEKTIQQEKEKQQILESQNEKLEEQVILRTSEIVKQKNEIEMQKKIVDDHQKEILDSIHYAKRIQTSLLPTEKYIDRILRQSDPQAS